MNREIRLFDQIDNCAEPALIRSGESGVDRQPELRQAYYVREVLVLKGSIVRKVKEHRLDAPFAGHTISLH